MHVAFLLLVLVNQFYAGNGEAVEFSEVNDLNMENECTIFLAESSIPNSGQGMYTIKDISRGSPIGEPDVEILCDDLPSNHKWLLGNYFWSAEYVYEFFSSQEMHVFAFPIGSLANYHTSLKNAGPDSVNFNNGNISRADSPGAGAFSDVTRVFVATREILAGEEIFTDYGEHWLDDHNFDDVPKVKNFNRAERIVQELLSISHDLVDEKYLETVKTIVGFYDKKTASVLPSNEKELKFLEGNTVASQTINKRSIEWIKENGQCLDNIVIGSSKLPDAGLGAFAKRFIPKGELVVPIPLLQIIDRDTIKVRHDRASPKEDRLLLNYCFGHKRSKMVLCPTTHGAFINHYQILNDSSNKECSDDGPNAVIQWSNSDKTKEWSTFSLEEIGKRNQERGLTFDVIALRDIKPGEEIFIDYGSDWSNAWNEHVENWQAPKESHVYPHKMNENNDSYIRTIYEQQNDPYPSNIQTVCAYYEVSNVEAQVEVDNSTYPENIILKEENLDDLVALYHIDGSSFAKDDGDADQNFWPCTVYKRSEDLDKYTVRILQSPAEEETWWTEAHKPLFLTDLSRDCIRFCDKIYSSDLYLSNAFRHFIGIPNDIFPEAWKSITEEDHSE